MRRGRSGRKTPTYSFAPRFDGDRVAEFPEADEQIVHFGRCLGREGEVEYDHHVSWSAAAQQGQACAGWSMCVRGKRVGRERLAYFP